MPRYTYRAKDSSLKLVDGTIEAENQTAAIAHLGSLGVYPLVITEASPESAEARVSLVKRRVPTSALAYLNRQLADLLNGGLSLFNALSLVSQQTEHRLLRTVMAEVADAVHEGHAFSAALGGHPEAFPPLYVSMIKAGEAGGGLEAVLGRLADLAEHESELRSRLTSALVYPVFVLCVGLAMTGFLLTYVIPRLATVFAESDQLLPLPTRILLGLSGGLSRWWWGWLAVAVLGVWGVGRIRVSASGRAVLDQALLRLPLVGALVRKIQTARLARNLGVMHGQGVPLLQALEVATATVTNARIRQAVQRVREAVRDGASLAQALLQSGAFPIFVTNMVAVGEEAGTLETTLLKVASAYERETDRMLRVFTTILEPALIVLVGLVVMFIVISMLLPIFQLGLVAQ